MMMEHEFIVFIAFVGIHGIAHFTEHFKESKIYHKIVSMHIFAVIVHPAVGHAVVEYIVHIVVYSGRIIGH